MQILLCYSFYVGNSWFCFCYQSTLCYNWLSKFIYLFIFAVKHWGQTWKIAAGEEKYWRRNQTLKLWTAECNIMKMIILHLFYCCMAIYTIDYNGFYLFFACSQIVLLTEGVFKLIGGRRISMKLLTISTKNLVNLLGWQTYVNTKKTN